MSFIFTVVLAPNLADAKASTTLKRTSSGIHTIPNKSHKKTVSNKSKSNATKAKVAKIATTKKTTTKTATSTKR